MVQETYHFLRVFKSNLDIMISSEDIAYIAGLFDGEGSIYYAKRIEKKKRHKGKGYRESMSQRISMEITMTDESVVRFLYHIF